MRTKTISLVGLLAMLLVAFPAIAQNVTLTPTTLSAAVASSDRVVCLTSVTGVVVPTTGTAGSTLFILSTSGGTPGERMTVTSVTDYSASCLNVTRANRPIAHASGDTVYVGSANNFYANSPAGSCVLTSMAVRPWINMSTGNIFDCVSSTWTLINGPATQGVGLSSFGPSAAGTVPMGGALLPWQKLYIGTAATNNFVLTPATTSAARVITMADPGGAATLAYTNSTSAQTITSTTKFGDSSDPTKALALSLSGATASKTTTLTFAHSNDRAITFPDATDTLVGKATTDVLSNKSFADPSDATKKLALSLSGATASTTSTFTFAQTVNRAITFPDAAITVSGVVALGCGTANACSPSNKPSMQIVEGISAAADNASPSTIPITGISPAFTSATTYACVGNLEGNSAATAAKGLAVTNVSGSAFTFTTANTSTEKSHYICVGF